MNNLKKVLCLGLVLILLLGTFTGCKNEEEGEGSGSGTGISSSSTGFTYSDGITDEGMWEGLTALDLVTLPDFSTLVIKKADVTVTEDEMQEEINTILEKYVEKLEIKEGVIADGDTVNIDYIGFIDDKEFANGSTNGAGTEVTIGVTSYIDDFLEQLIGHKPGDTFYVEVTFPEDYGNEEVNGKDARFLTTINFIVEEKLPELTDTFVKEKLQETYLWTTVAEMRAKIEKDLYEAKLLPLIEDWLIDNSVVSEVPEEMVEYQKEGNHFYFETLANYYKMDLATILGMYVAYGVETFEDMDVLYQDAYKETAQYFLVMQAVAEKEGLKVTEEDRKAYFKESSGSEDYSEVLTAYGMPYVNMIVLNNMAMDKLVEAVIFQ